MPEYLAPGVYVEEIDIGPKPIEGVSTSTAGFLGEAERGPIAPKLITGFTQFQRIYGKHVWTLGAAAEDAKAAAAAEKKAADDALAKAGTKPEKAAAEKAVAEAAAKTARQSDSFLPYAVEGFFTNGGKRCYIARIAGTGSAAAKIVLHDKIGIEAVGPGAWGSRIGVAIRKAGSAKTSEALADSVKKAFTLVVYYWSGSLPIGRIDPDDPDTRPKIDDPDRKKKEDKAKAEWVKPDEVEHFDNLSWDPDSPEYYVKRLHGQSHLINVTKGADGAVDKADVQAIVMLKDGADGVKAGLAQYQGEENTPSGLAAFVEKDDISIVCAPDTSSVEGLTGAVVAHCELMRDRIAVLHADENAPDIGELTPISHGTVINSKYAAFYYPWIKVIDPVTSIPRLVPPSGHVAGIYARSDTERGVHKAPANEQVRGAVDLQFNVNKGDQDMLNPRGVNCIRSFPGRGILLWGARTTTSDPLWKYVNVRRLFLFLEKSIERATQWVVFEPNNERLWARVRQSVNDFLLQVWKDGALMGKAPEEAFIVRCDKPTTMTDNDLENGRLVVMIGVAPARPAEFVIFRLAQWRSGSSITE